MPKGTPPEEYEPWNDYGKPVKKRLPIPKDVKPDTMLRLAIAARVAFPDGSMSVGALRRAGIAKRLRVYRVAGKDFTTIARHRFEKRGLQHHATSKQKRPSLVRPARGDRAAIFVIRDRGQEVSTGCGAGDRDGAERDLGRTSPASTTPPAQSGRW